MSDPTGVAPPLPTLLRSTAVTPTDHGQIVVLVAWLCFTAGILLSLVRLYIRWPLSALAGKDDLTYAISTLFAIIQTAITIHAVTKGFGRTELELSPAQALAAAKSIYATDIIYLFSIWTGKLSVSFLFSRLAQESNKTFLGWVLSGLISVFAFISILSVAIRPDAAQPWLYHEGDVVSVLGRWIGTGIMSILTDVIITALSIYLVWDLNMVSKSKSLVITAFTLRLFVTPVTIARLVTLSNVQHDDLSFSYSLPEIMTQLEMYCNLFATTLPCLRLFLTAWNTSFMDMRLEEIDNNAYREHVTTMSGSGSRSASNGASKNLSANNASASHSKNRPSRSARAAWAPSNSGKSKAYIETLASQNRDHDDAASDNSERAIVVKTTVDITGSSKF